MKRFITVAVAIAFGCAAPVRAQHDMSRMGTSSVALPLGVPWSRVGSGTSWLPDSSPMYAWHRMAGSWMVMLHGAAFGQYDHQAGIRGDTQVGLVDWEMLMAARPASGGVLRVNVMTSLQPFVIGKTGYPELLQTSGSDDGFRLVDRQHPHDLLGEAAVIYDHSLAGRSAISLYLAPVGEPALGPVAYMHRPSAWEDPFAPIGHHWQDATHDAHGVVTLGLQTRALKVEGSMFNGRDSDDDRFNVDYRGARLDSYSGRVTLAPIASLTLAAWAGYLYAHDRLDVPIGMQRYGASLLTVRRRAGGTAWSTAFIAGLNVHHHGARHHNHVDPNAPPYNYSWATLVESTFDVTPRATIYGRAEQVDKSGDDLGFLGDGLTTPYRVRALTLGGSYEVAAVRGASVSLGARASVTLLPETLRPTYHTTRPMGVAAYLRLRPSAGGPR